MAWPPTRIVTSACPFNSGRFLFPHFSFSEPLATRRKRDTRSFLISTIPSHASLTSWRQKALSPPLPASLVPPAASDLPSTRTRTEPLPPASTSHAQNSHCLRLPLPPPGKP